MYTKCLLENEYQFTAAKFFGDKIKWEKRCKGSYSFFDIIAVGGIFYVHFLDATLPVQ